MITSDRTDPVLSEPKWIVQLKYVAFSFQVVQHLVFGIFLGNLFNFEFPIPHIFFLFSVLCLIFVIGLYLRRHGRGKAGWLLHYSSILCIAFGAFVLAFLPFKFKPGFPFPVTMTLLGLFCILSVTAIYLQWYKKPAYKMLLMGIWVVSLLGVGQLFLSYFGFIKS